MSPELTQEGWSYVSPDGDLSQRTMSDFRSRSAGHRLLTAIEERNLAQQIEEGREAKEFLDIPLDDEDEERMKALIYNGDQARAQLINSNYRLVHAIARSYAQKPIGERYGMADLFQEGVAGLITAVDKFDLSEQTKLSTTAVRNIKGSIARALANKGRLIRIPVHIHDALVGLNQLQAQRLPDEKIQYLMTIDEDELEDLKRVRGKVDSLDSLDRLIESEDSEKTALSEFIANPHAVIPGEFVDSESQGSPLFSRLQTLLSKREEELLVRIMEGDRLEDNEQRVIRRFKGILRHPAVIHYLGEFAQPGEYEDGDWRNEAACKGKAVLYTKPMNTRTEKTEMFKTCASCQVRDNCKDYFEEKNPDRGKWIDGASRRFPVTTNPFLAESLEKPSDTETALTD